MSRRQKKEESKSGKRRGSVDLLVLFLIGVAIMAYPSVSNYLSEQSSMDAVQSYSKHVVNYSEERLAAEWELAEKYNENLKGDPVHDPFVPGSGMALPENYTQVLNVTNDGIMGHVVIPCIDVDLPIYHGTSSEVLKKGVGHIEQTALPIGGKWSNSVLTGHTGLPTAKLFTDLLKMQEGDIFEIYVLDRKMTYQVDNIMVILPEELENLEAVRGKDYVTLLTCTPYGVNDHRLIVRGVRIPNNDEQQTSAEPSHTLLFIIVGIWFVLLLLGMIFIVRDVIHRWGMKAKGRR